MQNEPIPKVGVLGELGGQNTNEQGVQSYEDVLIHAVFPEMDAMRGRLAYEHAIQTIDTAALLLSDDVLATYKAVWDRNNSTSDSTSHEVESLSEPELDESWDSYAYTRMGGFSHDEICVIIRAAREHRLHKFFADQIREESEVVRVWLDALRQDIAVMEESVHAVFKSFEAPYPDRKPAPFVGVGKYGALLLGCAENETMSVVGASGRFLEEAGAIYLYYNELESSGQINEPETVMHLLAHERMHSLSTILVPAESGNQVFQHEQTPGYQVGFMKTSPERHLLYSDMNEAVTEHFAREVAKVLRHQEESTMYQEVVTGFRILMRYLENNAQIRDIEKTILQAYVAPTGLEDFAQLVDTHIGPNGFAVVEALMLRPNLLSAFLDATKERKNGDESRRMTMKVDILRNARPFVAPSMILKEYPFITLIDTVRDPETGEWKEVEYTE